MCMKGSGIDWYVCMYVSLFMAQYMCVYAYIHALDIQATKEVCICIYMSIYPFG